MGVEAVIKLLLGMNTSSKLAIIIYILIQLAQLKREDNFVGISLEVTRTGIHTDSFLA